MLRIRSELGKLKIAHPDFIGAKTYLTTQTAASASLSTVENNDKFATNDYVVIGGIGEEKTEIVLLTSTSGSITLGHTSGPSFAHAIDSPAQEVPFNQVEIHTATSEGGTYSLVATLDLGVDEPFTEYATASTTWYKVRYKNAQGTTYSAYSPVVIGTGYDEGALGYMIYEVANELDDSNHEEWTYNRLRRYAKNAVVQLSKAIGKLHLDCLVSYSTQTGTAGTQLYDLPTRFLRFRKIDIAFDGSTYRRATFESEAKGLPGTDYSSSSPRVFRRGTQYGIRPDGSITGSSIFRLWSEVYPTEMSDDDDLHGLPYGAHLSIMDFMLWRAWLSRDEKRSRGYKGDYVESRNDYLEGLSEGFSDYQLKSLESRGDDLEGLEAHVPTDW